MKKKNNLFVLSYIPLLVFPIVGCNSATSGKSDVWCASGYEKILPEQDYQKRYKDDDFVISMVKNEYEASQIVISSNIKSKYEITLNNLSDDHGHTLSKDLFHVYHEKMITLTTKHDYLSPNVIGDFPDCLLPYEKAVEYGENYVNKNSNQPLWINVRVSKDTPAGVYKGTFNVLVGDKKYDIPVRVTIYDYTLSDVTYSESSFVLRDSNILLYEMDSSEEMLETYYDFFLDHRLSTNFPFELCQGSYNYNYSSFLKYALKYSQDDRCSLFNIPYYSVIQEVEIDGDGLLAIDDKRQANPEDKRMQEISGYDWDEYLNVLNAMVETSLSNGVDLFKKTVMPGTIFDEFTEKTTNGYMALNMAVYNIRRMDDIINNLSNTIDYLSYSNNVITQTKTLGFDNNNDNGGIGYYLKNLNTPITFNTNMSEEEFNSFKTKLKESILDTYCYVTVTHVPPEFFFDYVPRCAICYMANLYDTKESLNKIQTLVEERGWKSWVYTCIYPKYPYPTYHIEDMLLSSRLLGWQMYDYNIVGNLLWGTAIASLVDNDGYYNQLVDQDYYQTGARSPGSNGDGFLVYPGRHYGVYGPLSSIRLESILDANEDYDLLHALNTYYSDEEFLTIKNSLMDNLYDGMVISYEDGYLDNFASKRELLCSLLETASKGGNR